MRAELKGPHIPLVATAEADEVGVMSGLLLVTVRLSGGLRPVRLVLESGANTPILFFNTSHCIPAGVQGPEPSYSSTLFFLDITQITVALKAKDSSSQGALQRLHGIRWPLGTTRHSGNSSKSKASLVGRSR
jgi:hypothetical protein